MGHVVENARLQAACLAAIRSAPDGSPLDVRWPVSVKALQLPPYSSAKGAGTGSCIAALLPASCTTSAGQPDVQIAGACRQCGCKHVARAITGMLCTACAWPGAQHRNGIYVNAFVRWTVGEVGRLAAVELDDGQIIHARLVVGADGARSRY